MLPNLFFGQNKYIPFTMKKVGHAEVWAASVTKKSPKVKHRPILRRKIAQSGHPVLMT
jgi:hypothetical protein